jgi:hypothetical protein
MDVNPEWLPMRLPDSPGWHDPSALDLVRDTPIDCLAISWLADREQVRKSEPLLDRGRELGLSFVSLANTETDPSNTEDAPDFPIIPVAERSTILQHRSSKILAVRDGAWPSIKLSSKGEKDEAEAGPTGIPWVDSNGWLIRLVRAIAPEKSVWIIADPPNEATALSTEAYLLAISDATAYGGNWVLSLDDRLSAGLAAGNAQARTAWETITNTLTYFQKHQGWRTYQAAGILGVLSDFSGPNEFLSTEVLNLMSRRHLPFRILVKSAALSESFGDLKAILYLDNAPPPLDLHDKLLTFALDGGLIIFPVGRAAPLWGSPAPTEPYPRFFMYRVGRGRLAMAKRDITDPYVIALEAHILLSRRQDLLRLWNAGSLNSFYTASPDGTKVLIQLLNYARHPAGDVSLRVMSEFQSSRLWSLGAETPQPLSVASSLNGPEFHLPPISVYAAVELET